MQDARSSNNPKPTGRVSHHVVFPLCEVKRVKRKLVTSNGPEFTNEKHVGAGLRSSKVSKKASKGLYFTIASDQQPHHGAAKSWSRCRSGVSQCSNVGCVHGHLCLPGILASPLKTVQSWKALLPMYLSEGGMASSTRAAQFMKALTRIAWRVVGRRTSLRPVQCTKANSGISSTLVLQRSTLSSSRQLSHACALIATKCFVRAMR